MTWKHFQECSPSNCDIEPWCKSASFSRVYLCNDAVQFNLYLQAVSVQIDGWKVTKHWIGRRQRSCVETQAALRRPKGKSWSEGEYWTLMQISLFFIVYLCNDAVEFNLYLQVVSVQIHGWKVTTHWIRRKQRSCVKMQAALRRPKGKNWSQGEYEEYDVFLSFHLILKWAFFSPAETRFVTDKDRHSTRDILKGERPCPSQSWYTPLVEVNQAIIAWSF